MCRPSSALRRKRLGLVIIPHRVPDCGLATLQAGSVRALKVQRPLPVCAEVGSRPSVKRQGSAADSGFTDRLNRGIPPRRLNLTQRWYRRFCHIPRQAGVEMQSAFLSRSVDRLVANARVIRGAPDRLLTFKDCRPENRREGAGIGDEGDPVPHVKL